MKNNLWIMLFSIAFFSCSKKVYVKHDYTLYEESFKNENSKLRTDGVYVLENIWSKNSEGKKPIEHIFYKFYPEGQANLTVDLDHKINTDSDYIESIKNHIASTNSLDFKTHFESYYRIKGDKIVIQRVSIPRNLFTYYYAVVEKDKLIIVKETIDGKGKLDDKYFTDYYKETYRFLPLDKTQLENLKPGW